MALAGYFSRMKMWWGRPETSGAPWCCEPGFSRTQGPRAPPTVAAGTIPRLFMKRPPGWRPDRSRTEGGKRGDQEAHRTMRRAGRAQEVGHGLCAGAGAGRGGAYERDPDVLDDHGWAVGVAGLADQLRRDRGRYGEHGGAVEAGVLPARGRLRRLAAQCAAPAERPWPQDRCQRRRVDRGAGRVRPGPALVRAAQADPPAAGSDPLPQ